MNFPESHVRTVTMRLPVVGSRWVTDHGVFVTVTEVGHGITYTIGTGGVGHAATSFFLDRFRPVTEGS
jgi:hypothetical protein